jgi:EAL domain-containing protein (putative c-di-GMP-specific phosphodiesterase class I)
LNGETAYLSASLGITFYPDDALDLEALMKHADQAMYAAKNLGGNRFRYFTPAMQEAAQAHMRLATDLRSALIDKQFEVFYQPIVELASGAICKAEALIRWHHPSLGLVDPNDFIPVAENVGVIIDIGNWLFREAALQASRWITPRNSYFQLSVNKSPTQFHLESSTHATWLEYLHEIGLPAQAIVVEITEGLLLDNSDSVTGQLLEFRDAGIQVAIDDFGTGHSSLSYLRKFDIDYLKIDRTFVSNLKPASDDMALCEAIIVMAHKLGIKVIAEGIETEEQSFLLAAAGCDYGQGFYYSKPVPAAKFAELLEEA